MKKTLLFAGLLCSVTAFSQTTLFSDNFESGSASWTLNGGVGANKWVRNNAYTGYSGIINDTPDQPSGVTGFPQSYYMHVYSPAACSSPLAVCNSNFDTGSPSNQNVTITNPFVTTGMNNVTISFFYVCLGDPGISNGTLQYSTNNGISWTDAGTYENVIVWTQESVSLPAWDKLSEIQLVYCCSKNSVSQLYATF